MYLKSPKLYRAISKNSFLSFFVGAALLAVSSNVSAIFISDEMAFDARFTGTLIDFERDLPPDGSAVFSNSDVAASSPGIFDSQNGSFATAMSDWLCNPCLGETGTMTFLVDDVTAVGFNFGINSLLSPNSRGGRAFIQVFNRNTVLQSGLFGFPGISSFSGFVGVYGLGAITQVSISVLDTFDGGDSVAGMDNFRYGKFDATPVPEPSILSLFLIGSVFAVASFHRHRRYSKRSVGRAQIRSQ